MEHIDLENSLLRNIPPDTIEHLIGLTKRKSYSNNQLVFAKGDEADGMMIVRSGNVKIVNYAESGKEIIFRILNLGEVFGEIALIDGGTRTAEARAVGNTELLYLERSAFLPILETDSSLSLGLMKILCERLRITTEQLEDFTFLDLRLRLVKCLIHLAEQHLDSSYNGQNIRIVTSQNILAAMMGSTREAVNKRLRELEEEGLISLGRGCITIYDLASIKGSS